jgi:anti-sigma factor RsiW
VSAHPGPLLSAYADGELDAAQRADVEAHLAVCTECKRELSMIRTLGGAMREARSESGAASVWSAVDRRINRPFGWILVVAGVLVWAGLAVRAWAREALTLEWIAVTAVVVGLAMLALGVGVEQYREWKRSPYKELER